MAANTISPIGWGSSSCGPSLGTLADLIGAELAGLQGAQPDWRTVRHRDLPRDRCAHAHQELCRRWLYPLHRKGRDKTSA